MSLFSTESTQPLGVQVIVVYKVLKAVAELVLGLSLLALGAAFPMGSQVLASDLQESHFPCFREARGLRMGDMEFLGEPSIGFAERSQSFFLMADVHQRSYA
jgi:hypothetical protein